MRYYLRAYSRVRVAFTTGLFVHGKAYDVLATYYGATERDYSVFMVKDAVMSHNRAYTKVIEDISESVSFQTLMFMLEHLPKSFEKKSK